MTTKTLPITFREEETTQLMNYAQAGESASIVGVSGAGKSNLFNHLFEPAVRQHYLGDTAEDYIFVRINFHYAADFTPRSVYSLILEQFEALDTISEEHSGRIEQLHEALLNAGADNLKVQRYFRRAVRTLLGRNKRKLIFLFDQFAEVYREADGRLFANLRGLREDYKYRLSYFVFTRQSLQEMALEDSNREEFYELLAANIVGLKPYGQTDATGLLQRIATRRDLTVDETQIAPLISMSGGHGGLLRALYLLSQQQTLDLGDVASAADMLLDIPNIRAEAYKIWNSLSVEEQRSLAYHAHGIAYNAADPAVERLLHIKGILLKDNDAVFSPLFAAYVRTQQAVWEQPLYFDPQTRRVLVYGKPTESPLTRTELQIFTILYERMGEAVSSQEICEVIWPGIDADQHLKTNIYRLRRKVEPDSKNPQFIEGIHGYGYQLNAE